MSYSTTMGITSIIIFSTTLASFIIGIITAVAKLSVTYGRLQEQVARNEKRDEEERSKASVKFSELYGRTNQQDGEIGKLQKSMEAMKEGVCRIEDKLDRLIEGRCR